MVKANPAHAQPCSVPGCEQLIGRHGGRGWCPRHYQRWTKSGDPQVVDRFRRWHPYVRYRAAHARVSKAYGPARNYQCRDCDRPALDWAYDYQDPDEVQDPRYGRYSLDPFYYRPLCRRCHKRFDMAVAHA